MWPQDFVDRIICGEALEVLQKIPSAVVDCCVTSPPYWGLRDYKVSGQLGLETTPEEYVERLIKIFREVRRILKPEGTLWLNLGDTYAGSGCGTNDYRTEASRSINKTDIMFSKTPPQQRLGRQGRTSCVSQVERGRGHYHSGFLKPKDLCGIPWRVAFALQAEGWWLRSDIIWAKPNAMPESVKDRPTKAHEYIFFMTKSRKYYFDAEAVREKNETRWPASWGDFRRRKVCGKMADIKKTKEEFDRYRSSGRNIRSVWFIPTRPYPEAHFAVFPTEIPERCLLAGCPPGGIVIDPFVGSGTTAVVAKKLGRHFIGIDINPEYCQMAERRLRETLSGLPFEAQERKNESEVKKDVRDNVSDSGF